jgi:hypothetical protein
VLYNLFALWPRDNLRLAASCAGAGTGRAAGVAAMKRKFVAASKEDQASAAAKYPTSKVNWRRGFK